MEYSLTAAEVESGSGTIHRRVEKKKTVETNVSEALSDPQLLGNLLNYSSSRSRKDSSMSL
jgi:hypothetical protein